MDLRSEEAESEGREPLLQPACFRIHRLSTLGPTSLPATEWDLPRSPIDSLPVNANARGWRVE